MNNETPLDLEAVEKRYTALWLGNIARSDVFALTAEIRRLRAQEIRSEGLVWTREVPKAAGYYWRVIIAVSTGKPCSEVELIKYNDFNLGHGQLNHQYEWRFSGPIPEPLAEGNGSGFREPPKSQSEGEK